MTREEAKKAKDRLYDIPFDYDGDALIDRIFDGFKQEMEEFGWHTGTPTGGGWYLFQFMDKYGIWYSAEYLSSERIEKLASLGKFEMCAWQKIEPYKEASE